MKLLLVEDDEAIARVVRRGLEAAQFDVDVATDGAAGLQLARRQDYALLILDVMLHKLDGWRVCEELRADDYRLPILMLTARGETEDKVRGFDVGADDYLVKPFAFPELLARVRALLRRDKIHRTRLIRIGDLELDTTQRRVTRAGMEIELSHREYELLAALAAHEGRVLSRETIQERVWMAEECNSNTVDVYIGLLRKKIDFGHEAKLIQTVRGTGYALRRPEVESSRALPSESAP